MRCIHAHVISVHSPSDLCPIWLERCRRCLWPRMLLTWITLVPISVKNCTEFQQHISAFFELIVRPTSKSCFHIFLLLTGVYHSIHTAWAGLGFPWSLRKGRHESGSLNSKNSVHLVPKGPDARGLKTEDHFLYAAIQCQSRFKTYHFPPLLVLIKGSKKKIF